MADEKEEKKEYSYTEWVAAMDKFQSSIGKDLAEIRKAKAEVQKMKNEVMNQRVDGAYLRDEKRIVLSAPEIVIGDVDLEGKMWQNNGRSYVVIKGNDVVVDGVSEPDSDGKSKIGSITHRAPKIVNLGIDAGADGNERAVMSTSAILNMAHSLSLHSTKDQDVWCETPSVMKEGINIFSDSRLILNSAVSVENKSKALTTVITDLTSRSATLTAKITAAKAKLMTLIATEGTITTANTALNVDEITTRTSITAIEELHDQYADLAVELFKASREYIDLISEAAEVSRQLSGLKKQKQDLDTAKGSFKDKTTGAQVVINAEQIGLVTRDGDGNIRENKETGIFLKTKNFKVRTTDDKGATLKDSQVLISTENMDLTTANPKVQDVKKPENAETPAAGKLHITSKDITIDAVDYDLKEGKQEEKALTAGGIMRLRAENITVTASDKDAKATGKVLVAAKDVEVSAFDLKKEEGKPLTADKIAGGGSVVVSAEKVLVGSKSKDNKAKTMQVAGDKMAVIGNTTAEMQQGDGKAVLTLDGGNVTAGGSKVEIIGATTVTGTGEVKGELKTPKITADNVEAKTSFKSTNISDGVPVPPAPASGSPSAKLKAEESK